MAYSEPAGMYLNEFAILEQPVDCAALIGDKASFSVTAYGDDLTYQWEASRDGVNWTASTAAGSQTDTISGITVTEDRIGRWYRCRVTDTNGTEIVSSHVMIRSPFDTWEYTYNADGLRVGKTNTETTYQYYYNGDKLSRMVVNGDKITFGYDANGAPQYVIYGGHRYFYLTNLQGDVTGIVSMDGEIVVAYSYDAWGNPMPATGEMAATLGKDNPLRYRGYVYDEETRLYYLQSRYYDPALGRFINADAYASTGQGLLGNNMFAYCGNNPVNHKDSTGTLYTSTELHNFVLQDICNHDPRKTYQNTYMTYTNPYWRGKKYSYYGYCDLYDTVTHEIWDAKRFMGGITCTKLYAMAQVSNYVNNGTFVKQAPAELKIGGSVSSITPNCFVKPDRDGQGNYVMWYWDAGDGVIFYDYAYIPSGKEALGFGICVAAGIAFATGNIPLGSAIGSGATAILSFA